jgi:hypothetical protein
LKDKNLFLLTGICVFGGFAEFILSEAEGSLTCTANQYAAGFTHLFTDHFHLIYPAHHLLLEKLAFNTFF